MRCPHCQAEPIPDDARICPHCSWPLTVPEAPGTSVRVTVDVGRAEGGAEVVGAKIGEVKGDVYTGYTAEEVTALLAALGAVVPPRPGEAPPPGAELLEAHLAMICKAIADGRVVPFLGAGANLCGRPEGVEWRRDHYPPSAEEVSAYLADDFGYPPNEQRDLQRVSQYVATMSGSGPLYEKLRALFDADYQLTPLHHFLAALPSALRAKGYTPRYPLIVSTNYDDLLERAFHAAHEPYDLVVYIAEGDYSGKFVHWPPDAEPRLVERPNEYRGLSLDQRTVILRLHGAVDRADAQWDSFVITEDDYIAYLARTDVSSLLPVTLAAKLKKSNFLFLGYSLRDWNLRVILQRIWGEQKLSYKSWAVLVRTQALEQEFWRKRDVEILNLRLEDYIAALAQRIQSLPAVGARS
jgi:hypothetical protein